MTAIDRASLDYFQVQLEQLEQRFLVDIVVKAASRQCKYPILTLLLTGYSGVEVAQRIGRPYYVVKHYISKMRYTLSSLLDAS
jgi:hypothetical protein